MWNDLHNMRWLRVASFVVLLTILIATLSAQGAAARPVGKVIYEAAMGRDRQKFSELPTSLEERPDARELIQLNGIILRACEDNVSRRYHSAAELHGDLLKVQSGPGLLCSP